MEEIQQIYTNPDGKTYMFVEFLGEGTYGKVVKVIDDNQKIYALKQQDSIRPVEKEFIDKIKSEGDGVLKIYEFFKSNGKVCVVQEYCNQGNLYNYLEQKGQLEIKEAQQILLQLSKQLSIIHSMGYIFFDLKPENIIIKEIDNKLKFYLCDFGSLININNNNEDRQLTQSRLGTPNYMAPESIDLSNELDQTIDIWALGVIYYELIAGKKLFDGVNKTQIFKQIKSEKQDKFYQNLKTILQVDEQKDKILLSMFNLNPKNRPNIEQVQNYLLIQQKKLLKQENIKLKNELKQMNDSCQQLQIKYQQLETDQRIKYEQLKSESQIYSQLLIQGLQDNNNLIEQNKQDKEIKHIISNQQQELENINYPIQTNNYMIKVIKKEACSQTDEIQEIVNLNLQINKLKQENKVQQQELDYLRLELKNQQQQFQIQVDCQVNELKIQLSSKISYYFKAIDDKFIEFDLAKTLILDLVYPRYPINLILSEDKNNSFKFLQKIEKIANICNNFNFSSDFKQIFYLTDDFNFEDIDERERQIAKLQDLFQTFPNKIGGIFIATKFERNDIMKKSIMLIYKYFQKFQNLISIVVTDFHLSNSPQEDQEMLREVFVIFKPKSIIFIGDKMNLQKNELIKSLSPLNNQNNYPFNTKDTIFEPIDLNKQSKIMKDLYQSLSKQNVKNQN